MAPSWCPSTILRDMNGRWKDHKLKVPEPPALVCLAATIANMVSCLSIMTSSLLISLRVTLDNVVGDEGIKSLEGGLQRTCVTDAEIESTCFEMLDAVDFSRLPLPIV